jgi:hypothetical protein
LSSSGGLSSGGSTLNGGYGRRVRGIAVGGLDGQGAGALRGLDGVAFHLLQSEQLGSLVVELNETITARASVLHGDDVGILDVILGKHGLQVIVRDREGKVGNKQSGLAGDDRDSRGSGGTLGGSGSTATSTTGSTTASTAGTTATTTSTTTTATTRTEVSLLLTFSTSDGNGVGVVVGTRGALSLLLSLRVLLARGGELNVNLASSNLLLGHLRNSLGGILVGGKVDKSITTASATTGDDVGTSNLTDGLEGGTELGISGREAQVSNKYFGTHYDDGLRGVEWD